MGTEKKIDVTMDNSSHVTSTFNVRAREKVRALANARAQKLTIFLNYQNKTKYRTVEALLGTSPLIRDT